jgi:hypothetical protein
MNNEQLLLVPAQVWVGPSGMLVPKVVAYLQRMLCSRGGCITCLDCRGIAEYQHHSLRWLAPEKTYTLDDLESVFEVISLKLELDEHFFFVFTRAEHLSEVCSNKLLKSVEEPPRGYHFIFLTNSLDALLPTIISRCVVSQVYGGAETFQTHPLWALCTLPINHPSRPTPQESIRIIDKEVLDERESFALADALLSHWSALYVKAQRLGDKALLMRSRNAIEIFERALVMPPMPGSSKLFWRMIVLNLD